MPKLSENEVNVLLAEYQNCTNKVHRYSTLMWQTGAIFIAGSLILLSAVIQLRSLNPIILLLFAFASVFTLLYWQVLYRRYRWYNRICFYRARAIENYLVKHFEAIRHLPVSKDEFLTEMIESWITYLDTCNKQSLEKLPKDIQKRPWKTYNFTKLFIFFLVIMWIVIIILEVLRIVAN